MALMIFILESGWRLWRANKPAPLSQPHTLVLGRLKLAMLVLNVSHFVWLLFDRVELIILTHNYMIALSLGNRGRARLSKTNKTNLQSTVELVFGLGPCLYVCFVESSLCQGSE